ncbi:hypothetical protein APA65_03940, partial [Pseudomonas aeruginosa]
MAQSAEVRRTSCPHAKNLFRSRIRRQEKADSTRPVPQRNRSTGPLGVAGSPDRAVLCRQHRQARQA